ncbi:hypothetical protein J437_LFUL014837 [Ladona fulva]|uniref:Kazal-like domain-containing protein n=1 Tax=Ladona fulva TaxID=123851 RepID=A0A8K0KH14_LADFU|nr:hypothetical protein J437_LFUL014837 [Ladona fulva]
MKSTFFVLLALCVCLSLVAAQRCPDVCTADYNPVCGQNSKGQKRTFSNSCQLNVYSCKNPRNAYRKIKNGAC